MAQEKKVKVLLGYDANDQYIHSGQMYGPGVVEVPEGVAEDLVAAVRRVQARRGMDPEKAWDPMQYNTPKPEVVEAADELTVEQLEALLAAKKGQRDTPTQPSTPLTPVTLPPVTGQTGAPVPPAPTTPPPLGGNKQV